FVDKLAQSNYAYIPALPTDNQYLPEGYLDILKKAFGHRKELLEAYLQGRWDCFDGERQVIKNSWVTWAKNKTIFFPKTKRIVSCDPARFGNDETVIYVIENSKIIDEEFFGQKDTYFTAGRLNTMSLKHGDIPIIIDRDGPVADGIPTNLNSWGRKVIEYFGSNTSTKNELCYNTRAEAWDYTAKQFSEGNVVFNSNDDELVSQLCTPNYDIKNGKLIIEPKTEVKKRLGRSPDRGDAYVMGQWGLQFVPYLDEKKRKENEYNENYISEIAC
ncbi:MAG TPA: hypothetical protein PLP05_06110, partial [Sedimentisphaerales bacterium]|nr:hypothetical protein [Sedimentisphaerales bacterium]